MITDMTRLILTMVLLTAVHFEAGKWTALSLLLIAIYCEVITTRLKRANFKIMIHARMIKEICDLTGIQVNDQIRRQFSREEYKQ